MPSTPLASALCLDGGEALAFLLRGGGDDQLAAILMRDAPFGAIGIELPPSLDAEPRHQAVGGVVNPGVYHLGIARGGLGSDPLRGVQDDHFPTRHGERARHRQTDDTGADNDAIHFLHG